MATSAGAFHELFHDECLPIIGNRRAHAPPSIIVNVLFGVNFFLPLNRPYTPAAHLIQSGKSSAAFHHFNESMIFRIPTSIAFS